MKLSHNNEFLCPHPFVVDGEDSPHRGVSEPDDDIWKQLNCMYEVSPRYQDVLLVPNYSVVYWYTFYDWLNDSISKINIFPSTLCMRSGRMHWWKDLPNSLSTCYCE